MCYLKNIASEQSLDLDSWSIKNQDTVQHDPISNDQASEVLSWGYKAGSYDQKHILFQLFDLVHKNNCLISKMNESLCINSQQVKKITINFENQSKSKKIHGQAVINSLEQAQNDNSMASALRDKLFGLRKYRYSLQTVQKFEPVLYKERNFNIDIKLVDKNGKHARNSNLLTLCFALCDSQGQWIHENRVGESIMKGKTETELIKGQAFFQKLYSREVSRIYTGGRVSIVIYPKPTNLRYNLPGPCEEVINIQDIEPLIIADVSIRAKKKE